MNQRLYDQLNKEFHKQFTNEKFFVRRDYRDVMRHYALGIPPYSGVGMSIERLNIHFLYNMKERNIKSKEVQS